MKKFKLQQQLKEIEESHEFSDLAIDIVKDMLDEYESVEEMLTYYIDEVDRELIYYSQAFNYLMDNNITDFEYAIKEWGATSVTAIAYAYLNDEVGAIINQLRE